MPGEQARQATPTLSEVYPLLQRHCTRRAACGEFVFAGQDKHGEDPLMSLYVPSAHGAHDP